MNQFRDRSPLNRKTTNLSNSNPKQKDTDIATQKPNNLIMANYPEISIAREMIPQYEGGSRNLTYFIQQCEKFIDTYRNKTEGQENCTFNKLLFEICCSKLVDAARDTLVISNCTTWSEVKKALTTRFGDPRNETLLENDLTTCFQLSNETYDQYYEKIRSKLQQLLEHLTITEDNSDLQVFKTKMFNQKALDTFKAGLLEPYRSFISYKSVKSLEDCLLQLRNYDNHQQQVNFLNFIRQKSSSKQMTRPITQQFKPTLQQRPPFTNQFRQTNFTPLHNNHYNNQNRSQFPRGPINIQNRQVPTRFPTNSQVFGRKLEPKPTPMSVSTTNTARPRNISKPQNHFQNSQSPNFVSEELYNIEEPQQIQLEFEDPSEYYENYENPQNLEEFDEAAENFPLAASEEQTST